MDRSESKIKGQNSRHKAMTEVKNKKKEKEVAKRKKIESCA